MRTFVVAWTNPDEARHGVRLINSLDVRSLFMHLGFITKKDTCEDCGGMVFNEGLAQVFDEINGHDGSSFYQIRELTTVQGDIRMTVLSELGEG